MEMYAVTEVWSNKFNIDDEDYIDQADVIALSASEHGAKGIVAKRKEELIRLAESSSHVRIIKSEVYEGSSIIESGIEFIGLTGLPFEEAGIHIYSDGVDKFRYCIKRMEVEP